MEEVFQWVVEGSKDFGFLDRAVWSVSQHLVALEHGCWVTPAHLLQVVETSRTPLTISSGGVGWTDLLHVARVGHDSEKACRYTWLHTFYFLQRQQGYAGTGPLACSGDNSYTGSCRRCGCAELSKWNWPPPTRPQVASSPRYLLVVLHTTSSGSLSDHPPR